MFNPNARWDRPLPQDNSAKADEPIEVEAIFEKGKITPLWFNFGGIRHNIKEVTYRWQDRKGQEILYYFSVSDGEEVFQIYLSNKTLTWKLITIS
jgi:hypothetical protein